MMAREILEKLMSPEDDMEVTEALQKLRDLVEGELKQTKLFQLMLYGFPRAVGHTTAELNGVKNTNAILIVANESQKRSIELPKEQMISLHQIPEALRGLQRPIIIDHLALSLLVSQAISKISALLGGDE